MKTIQTILLPIIALSALSQSPAWAHASLEMSTPAKDAQLGSAPADITLKFNEKLESGFSTIKVVDGTGHAVDVKKAALDPADASVLRAQLPVLTPGIYIVKWVAVGPDGHRRKGDYKFAVK